jgi:hypothetical protein
MEYLLNGTFCELEYPFSCDQEHFHPQNLVAILGLNNSRQKQLKLNSSRKLSQPSEIQVY